MGKKLYPTDTLKQAKSILRAWKRLDPVLKISTMTLESIPADVAMVEGLQAKTAHIQIELMNIRIQRDEATIGLWNEVKRTRAGFKGIYGDDSTEYNTPAAHAGARGKNRGEGPPRPPRI